MKDFKMPVAVITFLAAQAGGMVWFLSGMEGRVKTLEGKRLGDVEMIAKENRDWMQSVIEKEVIKQIKFMMPSSTGTVVK